MAYIKTVPGSSPVNEGERKVIEHLKANLPQTYTIIPNFQIIQRGHPPLEYDAVVIAPHAVYAIEIKDWHGTIDGDDHEWALNGEIRKSPYKTTNLKGQVLKSELEKRVTSRPWVQAVIIVVDDRTTLKLRGNVKNWTAKLSDAPALLTDRQRFDATLHLNDLRSDHAYLVSAVLNAAGARQHTPRSFGDYRVVETISAGDTVSEYKARNTALESNDKLYRLRVYAYDLYLSPDQLAQRNAMIKREALALQRVGNHPHVATLRNFFTDILDPNLFVTVLDWSAQPTLRSKLNWHQSGDARITSPAFLKIILGILQGLKAVHDAGVIHRDMRPENIHFDAQDIPLLTNFNYAKILSTDNRTLQGIPRQPDSPRQYMAPELAIPPYQATFASDLYGVGVILYEFFVGQAFFDSPEQASEENTILSPKAVGIDIPDALDNLIQRLAHPDALKRPQTATEVIHELEEIITALTPPPPVVREPAQFQVGDVIDGEYQVLEILGSGGSGQMYKVYQALPDTEFALKVFYPASFALTAVQREIRALLDINKRNNQHIVKVINAKTLPSGRYYLVSEFVRGKDLTHYTKSDETRLPVQQSVQLIDELLSALETIHPDIEQIDALRARSSHLSPTEIRQLKELEETGWIHRDIKPANLILSPEGIKLVDFNIAVRAVEAGRTYIGTPEYMLPGVGSSRWETDADLFAVGIVLYELVTGYHPYPNRQPAFNVAPQNPPQYISNLHPHFVDVMLRAVSNEPGRRFRSAKAFRNALKELQGVYFSPITITTPHDYEVELEDWERDKPNYNPYVTRLLRLYSQAIRDNSGTRGYDQIAQLTYVRTRLDSHLGGQVLSGKHHLVIITGNAGDGKTAFIQSLEAKVKQHQKNIKIEKPTENSSTFTHEGRTFFTNYDGSQDEGEERANDLVLSEFFHPFRDESIDLVEMTSSVHIIAINQGRLLDFFSDATDFRQLGKIIDEFFDPPTEAYTLPDWLLIVDLNQRSMVAADPEQKNKSIFERQLEALLHPALWEPCNGCALHQKCFIKYNVDVLSDTASGSVIRERLQTLFEIVHLRRQLHITMRDMRSALAWMLFRDHDCDDVAQVLQQGTPQDLLSLLFYNAFASDSMPPPDRTDDRLVRLLREIDPAQVANPKLDRELGFYGLSHTQRVAFEKRKDDLPRKAADSWKTTLDQDQISTETGQHTARVQAYVRTLRRVAYFERRDDGWIEMLPYRKLGLFRQAAREQNTDELKETIANGISIIEGAGRQNGRRNGRFIFIRAGNQSKVRLKSFRLFPLEEFDISIPGSNQDKAVEYTPDRIIFYYDFEAAGMSQTSQRPPELHLSLDLLEMLYQAEEGYVLSTDDLGGVAIYLNMFKNALAHLPYRTIRLQYEEGLQFDLVHEDAAVLRLSQVEDEEGQE